MSILPKLTQVGYLIPDGLGSLSPACGRANTVEEIRKYASGSSAIIKMGSWKIRNHRYRTDITEHWNTPRESEEIMRKKDGKLLGDCDDISTLQVDALRYDSKGTIKAGTKKTDYKDVKLITTWGKKGNKESGHATCGVYYNDNIVTLGTHYRVNHFTKNVKDVCEFFYNPVYGISVYDLDYNPSDDSWKFNRIANIDCKPTESDLNADYSNIDNSDLKRMTTRFKKIDKDFEKIVKNSRKAFHS